MKKISVVIPNYNNGDFLQKTLESVIKQDYPKKEVIIVDDGSTDNSVDLIKEFIDVNNKADIRLICQDNLNAAIARNVGMRIATGDYILFLDSDDVLEEGVLARMLDIYDESNEVNLVIGSYVEVDEDDSCIGEKIFTDKSTILDVKESFSKLLAINPVPSNKLYDLKLIRANNLEWGNVRIGQDLNFYLKYLLLCKKVCIIPENIYKYRIRNNSTSRTFDFRIFDIVNVFEDVKRFYNRNGRLLLYNRYIPVLALLHYSIQMNKQVFYKNIKTRRLIVRYFVVNEKKLDYSLCKNRNELRKSRFKFCVKSVFSLVFTSKLYCRHRIKKIARRRRMM